MRIKNRQLLAGIGGLGTLVVGWLALRPVPAATVDNCSRVDGKVVAVSTPCCRDIEIQLANDTRRYYINRGLDAGVNLAELERVVVGKRVEMHVIERTWTPLDPWNRLAPVARITCDGRTVYEHALFAAATSN
jgi:hypothetical protein